MSNSIIVTHKGCFLLVKTSGVTPYPKFAQLMFFNSMVSINNNGDRLNTLFLSFCVALEPAGALTINGDKVA